MSDNTPAFYGLLYNECQACVTFVNGVRPEGLFGRRRWISGGAWAQSKKMFRRSLHQIIIYSDNTWLQLSCSWPRVVSSEWQVDVLCAYHRWRAS